jgi:hypothetical protein
LELAGQDLFAAGNFQSRIFLAMKFFVPEIFAVQNFSLVFFRAQIFLSQNFLAVKIIVPEIFPIQIFPPDPEIAISLLNLKIVLFWDFRFFHFLRSKFFVRKIFPVKNFGTVFFRA